MPLRHLRYSLFMDPLDASSCCFWRSFWDDVKLLSRFIFRVCWRGLVAFGKGFGFGFYCDVEAGGFCCRPNRPESDRRLWA